MRRILRVVSVLLIVAGGLLLVDAGLTLVWQEPVSAIYASIRQGALESELRELEQAKPTPVQERALRSLPDERQRVRFLARALDRQVKEGEPLGRIEIPSIGVDFVVVQGTQADSLREGPGHYSGTPLPGGRGTTAIAGHRTTYGSPFRRLDDLERGDKIVMTMPYARVTYTVERHQVVPPDAWWVMNTYKRDRIVLTACHPLYSASQRIVAFATLDRIEPTGLSRLS